MIYIVGGFCVAIAAVAIPLAFVPWMHVPDFLDITLACRAILEGAGACRAGAAIAGYATVGGLSLGGVLAFLMTRRWTLQGQGRRLAPWTYGASLVIVTALVGAHIVDQLAGPVYISRLANITRESLFISLEDLTWPVLMQLMNSQDHLRDRLSYLPLLLAIVVLSPYRAIFVAVVLFGFVLPMCERWWGRIDAGRFVVAGGSKYLLVSTAAILVMGLLGVLIYSQTRGRLEETGLSAGAQGVRRQTELAIIQRLTYPLFQAHFAGVVAGHGPTPTIADEILGKLRVSRASNLNQYLYSLVYGTGTIGEMTSLFYGEGAAYAKAPPVTWVITAPLLMVAAWLLFRQFGCETGTLMGIEIWRGSLGGLVPLLPALALQLLAMSILCWNPLKHKMGGRARGG